MNSSNYNSKRLAGKKFSRGFGPIAPIAEHPVDVLLCFAVHEEAKFFTPQNAACQVWLTGMGRKNAMSSIRQAIDLVQPKRVITAGFAGGLNPSLSCGAVLFEQDPDLGWQEHLLQLGAIPAKFYCHDHVAVTVAEKADLWRNTGADAVEMESPIIRTICRENKIPSATIRVISDDAHQNLPLDFNALMTADDRINYLKLFRTIFMRPSLIPKLMEFQRQTITASQRLGEVLEKLL